MDGACFAGDAIFECRIPIVCGNSFDCCFDNRVSRNCTDYRRTELYKTSIKRMNADKKIIAIVEYIERYEWLAIHINIDAAKNIKQFEAQKISFFCRVLCSID